jgi:hypothetical protein
MPNEKCRPSAPDTDFTEAAQRKQRRHLTQLDLIG